MKKHPIIAIVLLTMAFVANAQFVTVSEAYELRLSHVQIPATPSSGIMFKKCADCETMTVRVTPNTRYSVNGEAFPLKEFRARVFSIGDREGTLVTVLHHLESDVVVSVSVFE